MDGSVLNEVGAAASPLVDDDLAARIAAILPPAVRPEHRDAALAQALEIARRSNPCGIDVAMMVREDRERDYYNDHLYPWE